MAVVQEKEFSQREFEADERDISMLWNEAEARYTKITGRKLDQFRRTYDLIEYASQQMDNFHRFRHDKGKVDKMRSLFSANIKYIEAGTTAIVQAATPAFPPAATIGTAITYVLNAAKAVSADYDLIIAFFEDMTVFLQRITILEDRIPRYRAYQNCLVDVFASMLEMCGHAETAIQTKRLKKWFLKMVHMDDGALGPSRKKMDVSLTRLELATSNAILANTEESKKLTKELQQNTENISDMLRRQDELIVLGFESVEATINNMDNSLNAKIDTVLARIVAFQNQQESTSQTQPTATVSDEDSVGAQKVAFLLRSELKKLRMKELDTKEQEVRCSQAHELFVEGTCQWLFDEPAYTAWLEQADTAGTVDVLCISGNSGFGKTQMATFLYGHLRRAAQETTNAGSMTCVALILPPDIIDGNVTTVSILSAILIQVASQNASLCEQIISKLLDFQLKNAWDQYLRPGELEKFGLDTLWRKCFVELFGPSSLFRLQVIVDGADRMSSAQLQEWATILNNLCQNPDLRISVAVFVRPQVQRYLQMPGAAIIKMDWNKQQADGKLIIEQRMQQSERLKRVNQRVKDDIIRKLLGSSDGFLFVEHLIRQLKTFERTSSIERQLQQKFPSLLDDLFSIMARDYEKRLSQQQCDAVKTVFIWAGCANPSPTVKVLSSVFGLSDTLNINIDEELEQSQLKRFLRLRQTGKYSHMREASSDANTFDYVAFSAANANKTDTEAAETQIENDDDAVSVEFWDHRIRSFFVQSTASTSSYSAIGVESKLRTSSSEAHRQMFITCSKALRADNAEFSDLIYYASISCWKHHREVVFKELSFEDQIEFLEATALLLDDEDSVASNLVTQDTTITFLAGSASDTTTADNQGFSGLVSIQACISIADGSHTDRLSDHARKRILAIKSDITQMLQPLAKGVVRQWLKAKNEGQMLELYDIAYACWKLAQNPHDISPTNKENIGVLETDADTVFDLAGIVGSESRDPPALIVTAVTSDIKLGDSGKAMTLLWDALERCEPNSAMRLSTLLTLLNIQGRWNDYQPEAEAIVEELLGAQNITPSMKSSVLGHKARMKLKSDQLKEAFSAWVEARQANNGIVEARIVSDELEAMKTANGPDAAARLIRSWSETTRVQFLLQGYNQQIILELAASIDDTNFLTDLYGEIAFLKDGSPLQLDYARGLYRVLRDLPGARGILRRYLESPMDEQLYSIMNRTWDYDLQQSFFLMWSVCYEEFRSSTDPSVKKELYAEIEGLALSKVPGAVTLKPITAVKQLLFLARMAKKMGPATEFESLMNKALDICYIDLMDNRSFDKTAGVTSLCSILSLLNGFDDEIQLLASARISALYHDEQPAAGEDLNGDVSGQPGDNEEDHQAEENVEESPTSDAIPTPEADKDPGTIPNDEAPEETLQDEAPAEEEPEVEWYDPGGISVQNSLITCIGHCGDSYMTWMQYPKGAYHCLICEEILCPACYNDRQAWNSGEGGPKILEFCGQNHEYIQLPTPGWRGVHDMKFRVLEREEIHFYDLLDQIKLKWPKAWAEFYLEC